MKSTLRSTLAATAAMLLVPVGAMLTAVPAAAENAPPFVHTYRETVRQAEEARLRGDYDSNGSYRGPGYYGRDGYGRDDFRRDNRAPQILALTPGDGSRVDDRGRTQVAARFDDRGTGVSAVNLWVDGRDVTSRARIDGNEIRYAENLRPGRHVAELVVRDRAGNATRRSWSFEVVDDGRGRGYGLGRDDDHQRGRDRDEDRRRRW